jgi:hypothetical protein
MRLCMGAPGVGPPEMSAVLPSGPGGRPGTPHICFPRQRKKTLRGRTARPRKPLRPPGQVKVKRKDECP